MISDIRSWYSPIQPSELVLICSSTFNSPPNNMSTPDRAWEEQYISKFIIFESCIAAFMASPTQTWH